MNNVVENERAFRDAMSERGLIPPLEIVPDGKIHRCDANRKGGKHDGWYVYHCDGISAGAFGDWADYRGSQTWCSHSVHDLSPAERAAHHNRMESANKERAVLEQRIHAEKAALAEWIWGKAPPVTEHAYLRSKGTKSYGLRLSRDGRLIVPAYNNDGRINTLEFIAGDGSKRFLKGARKVGCWFTIGDATEVICIAEGYATGASVHEATGHQVMVAFDAGNLLCVAETIREKASDARIVLCADDDAGTDGNPGLAAATYAAQVVKGFLAVPNFGRKQL